MMQSTINLSREEVKELVLTLDYLKKVVKVFPVEINVDGELRVFGNISDVEELQNNILTEEVNEIINEEGSPKLNKYDFISNGINGKIIDTLIGKLKKYKDEKGFKDYRLETLVKDIIFFIGKSFDDKKYNFASGYDLFVEEVVEILKKEIKGVEEKK